MWAFIYTSAVTSAVEAGAFEIDRSFQILFMIIIGGLSSILGSFLGAAFILLLTIFLDNAPRLVRLEIPVNLVTNLQSMIFGDRQGEAPALAVPALTQVSAEA